jgi:manganese transport protein
MMGEFASPWALRVAAWVVAAAIVVLNVKLWVGVITG